MSETEAALAVCRFVHDAAIMLLWGASAYLAALVPRDFARHLERHFASFWRGTAVVAILTTVASLPIEVAGIGTGWRDVLDSATVSAVLFDTSVGHAWQVQMAAAFLLGVTVLAPNWGQPAFTALASGLLLVTLALTGHAAMHEGWLGAAHQFNDGMHVLAGGAWLGALVPLLPILRGLDSRAWRTEAGVALRRFSTAGHAAVALVIATGVTNTLLVLGRWPLDWTSPYQALLAAKIGIVAIMTFLAVANRYVMVPRMARDPIGSLEMLRLATLVEIGLGMTAIACVSVFGLLEPV